MASVVEPSINPLTSNVPIVDKYELTLTQAIQNVVAEIHKENPNLAQYNDVFYNLMQSRIDPSLETIWVFSALSFRSREITSNGLSDRVLIIKELFQLISGCAGPCGPSKSTALLAPVAFQVYKLVAELLGTDLGAKRLKKLTKEVKSLIGSILGYASVRSGKDLNEESDSHLLAPFVHLVSVWLSKGGRLESFLPLVSNEIFRDVSDGKCSVNYLARVVITEMLLLKLCLDLRTSNRGVELEKDLRRWVVGSVTAFQNFYLHDTLVNMLLEKILPVAPLLVCNFSL
uniref:Uncharacterized protein MANES_03G031600 n=1 Tax=Rhizophora mucronata TaxID=61149 RepID=A0A2P2J2D7_RHIMU